ncbi:MAG: type VI secretion system ImpA family N-terminal domain-containing protein [Rhizobiaceae bacterium]|nr:type VI secretion system ImpA family N-terminal domain-containing protein [Rhizobiaceae bacterium]MCV0408183.1 type VI secretion system ImpA family N-terminal domain-containing protein [Rhizobiaceae bacterium]
MRHERFVEPISESEPCGPDLDELGDEDYLNYVLPAEDRIPPRFYDPNTGTLFDRSSLDLRSELKVIDGLLERTRDLRLLSLEARFQAFAGSIVGVCDCINAIAEFVDRFWEDVHPKPLDPEDGVRQNIISAFDDRARIVLPLHYAAIVRDKRHGVITWRHYLIATGETEAREGEQELGVDDVVQAIGNEQNMEAAEQVHAAAVAALRSMARIRGIFQERASYESAPQFGSLQEFLEQLRKLIETARPVLAGEEIAADGAEAPAETMQDEPGAPADGSVPAPAPVQASVGAVLISSHAEAVAAMAAAEDYFAAYEPSAPALLLVHQARLLVGKPLVEAIQMLMPASAERTRILFQSGLKIQIGMDHLQTLTQDVGNALGAAANGPSDRTFETETRAGAAGLLAGVEDFYRQAEPSSPIPMLLAKARGYLNRDFAAILNDLIGQETASEETSD